MSSHRTVASSTGNTKQHKQSSVSAVKFIDEVQQEDVASSSGF